MLIGGYCIGVVEGGGWSDRGRGDEKAPRLALLLGDKHLPRPLALVGKAVSMAVSTLR